MHGAATAVEAEKASRFAIWWTERPLWYLVLVAIASSGVLFGVGLRPDFDSQIWRMDDPFNPIAGTTDTASPLGWIIGDLVGIHTEPVYLVFHLAILIAVLVGAAYLIARWISDWAARLFVAAWFASPLANSNVSWLGKPDHFTLFATVLIGCGPTWGCIGGGLLLGFNHSEQGVVIIFGSVIVRRLVRRESWAVAWAAAGWVVGRLLWQVYASSAGIRGGSGRADYILDRGVGTFTAVWAGNLPTLAFGAFGVLWLPAIIEWRTLNRRAQIGTVTAAVVAIIAAMATVDTTRVLALLTFPLVIGLTIRWAQRDRAATIRWMGWFLLAAAIVPRVQLWTLDPYVSSWDRLL